MHTVNTRTLEALVITKTRRVPLPEGAAGDGATQARQLDAALLSAGFKLSPQLVSALSGLSASTVLDIAGTCVLPAVWQLVGDHVQHNVYFRDFPDNVPDTMEFWAGCIGEALRDESVAAVIEPQLADGWINLLDLPTYGTYQHTYEQMLASRAGFTPTGLERLTVLHLGGTLDDELNRLYQGLAGSTVPLAEDDRETLQLLAGRCATGPQPSVIPVRENRALINAVRLAEGRDLLVDTVTDVLRLACALSGGDVTLTTPTRLRSLPRRDRRALLGALDMVVSANPAKRGDVHAHREQWKRLGERLHPHEFPELPYAAEVFAVARGELAAPSFAGLIESGFAAGDIGAAAALMSAAPGRLFRSLDRLLRAADGDTDEVLSVLDAVADTVGQVSGRVILSVREHLQNRARPAPGPRVFANRSGRAWVTSDARGPLPDAAIAAACAILDSEIERRLPRLEHVAVDADLLDVALPLSDKATPPGMGILPRGSTTPVTGELLRFFIYWRQTEVRTDFDLSALLLDADGTNPGWLSYTNLRGHGGCHSGDITSAPNGASEFIDLELSRVGQDLIIPQVNVFSGEGFDEVAESFFGFMLRDREQQGRPFEPATVRMKSDLRGSNRVALPMVFVRGEAGWSARWMHLFLRGAPSFNQVEGNRVSTWQLVEGILNRDYLTVRYLLERLRPATLTVLEPGTPVPPEADLHLRIDAAEELKRLIPA